MKTASVLRQLAVLQLIKVQLIASHPLEKKSSKSTVTLREGTVDPLSLSRRQQEIGLRGGPNYFGDLTLGSAQLSVLVDTGSPDLVINPPSIPTDGSVSSTDGYCFEAYGGNAGVNGTIYQGPYSFDSFNTNGQFCSRAFANPPANMAGIMGLSPYAPAGIPGHQTISGQSGDSPLYRFQAAGLGSFGIYISSTPGGGGAFTPNDYDSAYIADGAGFAQEDVDGSLGLWQFNLAGNFQYEGTSYDLGVSSGFVDTGNPTINIAADAAKQIWSLVGADPNDGSYSNCNPGGDPITITTAAGNSFDIPANVYVMHNPKAASPPCICAFQPIVARDTNYNTQAVLGAPFIKAYYTYFDVNNMQLNFAQSAG